MLSRAEHLQWAKERALAYLAPPEMVGVSATTGSKTRGHKMTFRDASGQEYAELTPAPTSEQLSDACASFLSDLGKHPEIDPSAAHMVFGIEALTGGLNTAQKVRDFINGTH